MGEEQDIGPAQLFLRDGFGARHHCAMADEIKHGRAGKPGSQCRGHILPRCIERQAGQQQDVAALRPDGHGIGTVNHRPAPPLPKHGQEQRQQQPPRHLPSPSKAMEECREGERGRRRGPKRDQLPKRQVMRKAHANGGGQQDEQQWQKVEE